MDIHYWEAECFKIDTVNKKVYCRSNQETNLSGKEEFFVDYGYLVIAMGARANTFNIPGKRLMQEVEVAQRIRRKIIECFERACLSNLTDEEWQKILQFVIIGGGPTGVEFVAELHDFVFEDLVKLYPNVKDLAKIALLEAGDHILNMQVFVTFRAFVFLLHLCLTIRMMHIIFKAICTSVFRQYISKKELYRLFDLRILFFQYDVETCLSH
ncbi:hypothetical protein LguiA_011270 [Lonicera macranthoides]